MLFAISAALLVRHYSPYAKQSGIPEVKTMLGGFVMKRFLGGWTLVTKSIGLVGDLILLVRQIADKGSVFLWRQACG